MQSLGEMATWLPLPGAIPQFCARYVDGAMGFAVGWNVSTWSAAKVVSSLADSESFRTGTRLLLPCVQKYRPLRSSYSTGKGQETSILPPGSQF